MQILPDSSNSSWFIRFDYLIIPCYPPFKWWAQSQKWTGCLSCRTLRRADKSTPTVGRLFFQSQ